ncbi:hypothetical protein [Echinicola pacifica]|uniref:hypothetical protein n=1 Tax=Echinicola pacifica TaxID=346377 RepID=UPI0012FBDB17|nr:hypothetical protein [Echinicola pacifica]
MFNIIKIIGFGLAVLGIGLGAESMAQTRMIADDWVATDALGRELPSFAEVGELRKDKLVGVFYYIWHGAHNEEVYDITQILADDSATKKWGPEGAFHFWSEPEYGYYRSEDPWVIRHDLQMLSNAKVDFIFFDVTNGFSYLNTVRKLCEVSLEMRNQGIPTPEICFLTNSKSGKVMNELYDEFYSKNDFKELWFYWDGKPLAMAEPNDPILRPEVKEFFTLKKSWAWTKSRTEPNHWQWLDTYPQDYGWSDTRSRPEQITVSTASHPHPNIGKSFHDGAQPAVNEQYITEVTDEGKQFAEQWNQAHRIDPSIVMITQWNEWVAQRFIWNEKMDKSYDGMYAGRPIAIGDSWFVDAFTKEYNRDIAPMKGGYSDSYYYQMVANIRKFKGMEAPQPYQSSPISVEGKFEDWKTVSPVYRDPKGDIGHRNFEGYDPTMNYTNTSGRNDIIASKVSYDRESIFFYAQTAAPLTSPDEEGWMLLFIDADQDKSTGWEGYDFVVNHGKIDNNNSTLKKWNGESWELVTQLNLKVKGSELELAVQKKLLGYGANKPEFNFHWMDNPQQLKDISAFFLEGDSAPDRRFDYSFQPKTK